MSGTFTVRVNMGSVISKAVRDIDKYDAEKQGRIRKVIADGTKAVRDRAVQTAPKGPTGRLRKGIKSSVVGDGREGIVTSTAPHSPLVELGTDVRVTLPRRAKALRFTWNGKVRYSRGALNTGRMKPQHFLKNAANQEWPHIVKNMEDALK
jgi:HK97 gp10 family phage protein